MTLTKVVEAVREALNEAVDADPNGVAWDALTKALAALPDKAMTEEEILKMIAPKIVGVGQCGILYETGLDMVRDILRALKAANVLYVSEEK